MTVIAAEDFHDAITLGERACNPDRIHGCLRAGVYEAPTRQLPSRSEKFGDDVGIFCWGREVCAESHAALHRFGDDRVRVPLHHAADAVVDVKVLVPINVPDVLAEPALEIDGVRRAALIAGWDTANERLLRSDVGGPRGLGPRVEASGFSSGQCGNPSRVNLDGWSNRGQVAMGSGWARRSEHLERFDCHTSHPFAAESAPQTC